MAKIYIEDIKLNAIRNKIFTNLTQYEQVNIFDAVVLSSGDYLPTQKMINGEYSVYGGGGITDKNHNNFNIASETLGIGRVGARCGCVFKIKPKSWITDNALYANKINEQFDLEFLIHFFNFKNLNQYANTAAQPVISLKRISRISIPKIDLKLQKEIAYLLNNVEQGIFEFENDSFGIKNTLNYINTSESLTYQLHHQLSLVKKLRQQLLQDAVQGKLVKNTEGSNESAHDLLKTIKAEKEQLIKEKKLKKEKELPPIKEDEIPFEIPVDWVWCRLGEICTKITDGFHNSPPKALKGIPYISATHVKSDKIDWEGCHYVAENFHRELFIKAYPKKGELLVVNIGAGCGTPAIIDVNFEFSFKNTAILKFNQELILNRLLFYYFLLRKDEIYTTLTKGGLQPFLSLKILSEIEFPLPPLNTQTLIVQKLESLMQQCDALESSIQASVRENEQLLQQVLREALQGKAAV
jgi:type I restriction enzyme S subunit